MSKVPSTAPFSLPEKLEPGLARVRAYWEGLKRGAADMPFADDVNITAMPDMSGRLMSIEVFDIGPFASDSQCWECRSKGGAVRTLWANSWTKSRSMPRCSI